MRSRADFTQYVTNDPLLIHPGVEDLLKGEIHKILDTQIVGGALRAMEAVVGIRRLCRQADQDS